MIILALDTATRTGWAIIDNGRLIESGVQDFKPKRGESNGMRFLNFRYWLDLIVKTVHPNLIIYEQAHHRGGPATEVLVNLTGRVQEVAAEHGIDYTTVHTGTLKKWACGAGNADKGQMMARAVAYLGRAPIDDNESDAVLMAMYAWNEYGEAEARREAVRLGGETF